MNRGLALDDEMVTQVQGFGERETHAVLDYVSRLEPPAAMQAPPGWKNPDFAHRGRATNPTRSSGGVRRESPARPVGP
jgi:hypothetical protein